MNVKLLSEWQTVKMIWAYTVYSGLPVRIRRVHASMAIRSTQHPHPLRNHHGSGTEYHSRLNRSTKDHGVYLFICSFIYLSFQIESRSFQLRKQWLGRILSNHMWCSSFVFLYVLEVMRLRASSIWRMRKALKRYTGREILDTILLSCTGENLPLHPGMYIYTCPPTSPEPRHGERNLSIYVYGECPKISYTISSDKMASTNNADPEQSTPEEQYAQGLLCLPFNWVFTKKKKRKKKRNTT